MSSIHKDHARRFEEEIGRGADPERLDEIGLGFQSQPIDLIDLDVVAQAMAKKRAAAEGPATETDDVRLTPSHTDPERMAETPPSGPSVDEVVKAMKANRKRRPPAATADKKSKRAASKPRLTSRQRAVAEGRGDDFGVM